MFTLPGAHKPRLPRFAWGNQNSVQRCERHTSRARSCGGGSVKRPRPKKAKLSTWQKSAAFRVMADAALRRYNRGRHKLPKCGALARSTGKPCQQIAMTNGRCYQHGGKTPSRADWHKTQWPDKASPNATAKMHRKLDKNARAARAKAKRLAAMSPQERAAYDKWAKAHKTGTAAERAATKRQAEQNAEARALLTQVRPPSAASEALNAQIAALEAEVLRRAKAARADGANTQPPKWDIFQ